MSDYVKEIIDNYKFDFLSLKNVVGIAYGKKTVKGVDTGDEALVFLVKEKVPETNLSKKNVIPQTINNNKTDVVEIGELSLLDMRTERVRPLQPGVSIGHYKISAGTLGAIVRDKESNKPLLLSNNHVFANLSNGEDNRAEIGDEILQPGVYDGGDRKRDVVAYLKKYIPIIRKGDIICPIARNFEKFLNSILLSVEPDYEIKLFKNNIENVVDCAVAELKDESQIDESILEIGKVNGIRKSEIDLKVKKSGRTTGVTSSKVNLTNATVEVQMTEKESAIFSNQFVVGPMSQAGDSGSLILDMNNKAVGLLFAGSSKATICNEITNVCDSLNIKF